MDANFDKAYQVVGFKETDIDALVDKFEDMMVRLSQSYGGFLVTSERGQHSVSKGNLFNRTYVTYPKVTIKSAEHSDYAPFDFYFRHVTGNFAEIHANKKGMNESSNLTKARQGKRLFVDASAAEAENLYYSAIVNTIEAVVNAINGN